MGEARRFVSAEWSAIGRIARTLLSERKLSATMIGWMDSGFEAAKASGIIFRPSLAYASNAADRGAGVLLPARGRREGRELVKKCAILTRLGRSKLGVLVTKIGVENAKSESRGCHPRV